MSNQNLLLNSKITILFIVVISFMSSSYFTFKKHLKADEYLETEIPISNDSFGIFTDNRDGQIYKWVRLKDDKKWMAQNLNYESTDSWCYGNEDNNCDKYGRLYTWQAVKVACPSGWRLPTFEEWGNMIRFYNEDPSNDPGSVIYKLLIKDGESGFSVLLGGLRTSYDAFYSLDEEGNYWSSTEFGADRVRCYNFYRDHKWAYQTKYLKNKAFSCRCLQD